MSQTSIIAASIVIAFFVFITVRGELPGYFNIFTGTPGATGTDAGGKTTVDISKLFGGGSTTPGVLVGPGGIQISFPGGIPSGTSISY